MLTKVMGIILFALGVGGILLGTGGFLNTLPQLSGIEETVFLFGGAILCVLGYIMARDRTLRDEEPKDEESELK